MAAHRIGKMQEDEVHSSEMETSREHGFGLQKRQARVTVKYNRKELQKRIDVEKWIDECLDKLYLGKEDDMPDEINIDELLDLPTDEERTQRLQEILQTCSNNTEAFVRDLLGMLKGLHKQEELQSEGVEHPAPYCHGHPRHEPYHFNSPHHCSQHHPAI
ncbi:protein phosphatase 1, regulatory (inhibitor) subunit 14Aa [Osmerus mordax]|uniref:protein phosphatase 1, regulatory (inhibitor) subunit 14Aa n=1 Tax=Osmerus mordax TaxID=8014 RepID=UPI00351005E6